MYTPLAPIGAGFPSGPVAVGIHDRRINVRAWDDRWAASIITTSLVGLSASRALPEGGSVAGRAAAGLNSDHDLLGMPAQRQRHEMRDPPLNGGREPVRRVHREGRLADPRHPADRVNAHRAAIGGRTGQRPQQLRELGLAAGGNRGVTRQRPGRRRRECSRRHPLPGRQHVGGRRLAAGRRDEQVVDRPF